MVAVIIIIAVLVAAIFIPDTAAAWGPSTHLLVGKHVLDAMSSANFPAGPLLTAYPLDFLYGSIFADMNLGKKFLFFARLAHNWRVGFRLLESAETEANRACAYGYLAHLAADTISHNEYVPIKLVEQYHQKGKGHIFFEVAFDAMLPYDPSRESKEIVREGSAKNDAFLEAVLTRTLLSFQTNRKIYRGILSFNRNNGIRAIRRWRARSQTVVGHQEVEEYMKKIEETVQDFLLRERAGACYGMDPHGKAIIKQAIKLRRKLRNKMNHENLSPNDVKQALEALRPGAIENR